MAARIPTLALAVAALAGIAFGQDTKPAVPEAVGSAIDRKSVV